MVLNFDNVVTSPGAMRRCGLTSWVVCFSDKFHDVRERNLTIRSEDLNYKHPFPRVSGYWKVCDIMEVDIMKFRV